jgi:FtsP/CotA-like multicopper oxidase with cupredoxin domain
MKLRHFVPAVAAIFVACGGGESGGGAAGGTSGTSSAPATTPPAPVPPPPGGAMTMPDWFSLARGSRTVHLSITAGLTPDNNHWNFNGFTKGAAAITVPLGDSVVIDFKNDDPNMAHSLGISAETSNFATPPAPTPVFPGAITKNPGSMVDGTMPGESETLRFLADKPGTYSMVCYVPGHTAVGMWIYFEVSAEGEAGVQTR